MKAILKFDLPEDATEFRSAVNGGDAIAVITELDNYLRAKVKYTENDPSIDIAAYQAIRDELRRLLEEYDVSTY
jgi:hypothetical protein